MKTILPTSRISNEVCAVNSRSSNYFIYQYGSTCICFDAGTGTEYTMCEFAKIGISPDHVTHVFLTHSDDAQTGGILNFKNARVYLSALEKPLALGRIRRFIFRLNSLQGSRYKLLQDKEKVRIGDVTVTAVSTPGHTPGSMSYLVNGTVLFTGDTVRLKYRRALPPPWWLNMNNRKVRTSLHAIARLDRVALLCTCESGVSSGFKRAMKRWDLKITRLADRAVNRRMNAMIIDLLSACFLFEPKFKTQRFFNEKPAYRWIIRDGKKLAAHLATHVKRFECNGKSYDFCGISEVAVRPEFRGHGIVGKLLAAAEDFHKGMDFSVLLGADAVYARYGYVRKGSIYFPDESGSPNDHAMVRSLSDAKWPDGKVVIQGKYF